MLPSERSCSKGSSHILRKIKMTMAVPSGAGKLIFHPMFGAGLADGSSHSKLKENNLATATPPGLFPMKERQIGGKWRGLP